MKNRIFALVWRIATTLIGISGIVLSVTIMTGGFGASNQLAYFTIQTNIFSTILACVLMIKTAIQIKKEGAEGDIAFVNPCVQLGVTFFITITFVVYWLLLSQMPLGLSSSSLWHKILLKYSNYAIHGIVPLMAVADWIMFMPHGVQKPRNALYWLSYPIAYLVFIIIRAQVGAPFYTLNGIELTYPYPFIDPAYLGGVGYMVLVIVAMAGAFYGLGRLYIFLDKKLAKKNKADDAEENFV